MNNAVSKVNIKACKNATSNSNTSMNNTNATETGAMANVSKIKIRQIKLSTMMWPAVMLANKRIINAKGFEITPISSTGIMIGYSHHGTSGKRMCFQ
ncbi:hypothetical protein D3C87_1739700 [compost metagenome]